MIAPLFLMAGGAANEYKAKLRADAEAQARLNEAQVTAEANRQDKLNLRDYGNIQVELPTSGDLYGMGSAQKARQNADYYMNWAQVPSNIAMLKANDPNQNNILMGDITQSFADSVFQPTDGDTAGVKDTYTKYDYEHLKESWPELYEELNKLNPWLLPNINLRNDVDMEEAFMEADKAYDIVEGKERKEKELDATKLIYHKDHEAIFGQDYAKNILTSQMYGGMSEENYTLLKSNKRKYQYTSLISTLTWRRDNQNMDDDVWGTELAQVKTFYNLSDKEVIEAMAMGMRKKSFDNKGNRITINKFKIMSDDRFKKVADAKSGYTEIVKDVAKIKNLFNKGAKAGMYGKMTNVMYGLFGGDLTSTSGDVQGQIDWIAETIGKIQVNRDGLFGLDEGEQHENFTIEHGSLKGTSQKASTSAESNSNLVLRLEAAKANLEKVKAKQGTAGWGRGEGNSVNPLSSLYYQAQLETLQIYLAYKLALTEQGSGGKAVSDKDFDNALKRVGDTWWTNNEQAISRLDLVAHKASIANINEFIHTEWRETGITDDILEYYHNFKDQEEKYVKGLRNYFILNKDAKMTERAKRLETTFAIEGETYGEQVDFNPWDESSTPKGRGSFWALNEQLSPSEKAAVATVTQTFDEFLSITNAGDGIIVDGDVKLLANNLKKLHSNPNQRAEDSMQVVLANMLKNGVDYEQALTAVAEEYDTMNADMISIQFIDLMKQGQFNTILGKNWYKKPSQGNKRTHGGTNRTKPIDNPVMPSQDRMKQWEEYLRSQGKL